MPFADGTHRIIGAPMPELIEPTLATFRCHLRVYWEDTDAGGVVFYANYLKFFERARTEWLRALGFSQQALKHDSGTIFVVSHTSVHYHRPARLDDELLVTVLLREAGRASMVVAQQAWRGTELIAQGEIRIGCVDSDSFKPRRIPAPILQAITSP